MEGKGGRKSLRTMEFKDLEGSHIVFFKQQKVTKERSVNPKLMEFKDFERCHIVLFKQQKVTTKREIRQPKVDGDGTTQSKVSKVEKKG